MVKTIGLLTLSSGILGEEFVKHEYDLGINRLNEYNMKVKVMPNALKGMIYLKDNPQKRAEDLITAFSDESIDMILCAIGGEDTYRLLPYLFENDELKKVINNKIFLGFSDTTVNHFMLHKLGLNTFYGQAFLPDVCELADEMLPYSKTYFEELINTGKIEKIVPSDVFYLERESFGVEELGKDRIKFENKKFELLQGSSVFSGKILGGCIESIYYNFFDNTRNNNIDTVDITSKYKIFPTLDDWEGKILLLETSEGKTKPDEYKKMILRLKEEGIFNVISGLLIGKPMDNTYYDEYNKILVEVINDSDLPILSNISIGHCTPRCIMPFGVLAKIDANKQEITFKYD